MSSKLEGASKGDDCSAFTTFVSSPSWRESSGMDLCGRQALVPSWQFMWLIHHSLSRSWGRKASTQCAPIFPPGRTTGSWEVITMDFWQRKLAGKSFCFTSSSFPFCFSSDDKAEVNVIFGHAHSVQKLYTTLLSAFLHLQIERATTLAYAISIQCNTAVNWIVCTAGATVSVFTLMCVRVCV